MEGNAAYREGCGIHFLPRTQWLIYIVKFWTPRVQILSISCSFGEIWKNHVFAPPKGWRPHLGEILGPHWNSIVYCGAEIAEYSPKISNLLSTQHHLQISQSLQGQGCWLQFSASARGSTARSILRRSRLSPPGAAPDHLNQFFSLAEPIQGNTFSTELSCLL